MEIVRQCGGEGSGFGAEARIAEMHRDEAGCGSVIQDVAHAHGCTAEIEIKEVTGIVVNDAELVALANEAAAELVPAEKIQPQIKSMLGDDFAEYRRIGKCCYVQVGMYNKEKGCTAAHHHGLFKVDTDVLPLCCAWMAACGEKAAKV